MTAPAGIDGILQDYADQHVSSGDPVLDAVSTAMFLEDVFDITLTDADISPAALGTVADTRAVVTRLLGSRLL